MASLMIPGSKQSDIWGRTSCFTTGLIVYKAGATMAMLTHRPNGRRVLAPRGCGSGVDDPTGVYILITVACADVKTRAKYLGGYRRGPRCPLIVVVMTPTNRQEGRTGHPHRR